MPVFALVDANNFYATCEKIFEPGLAARPLVVLSNNDGCIVARSAEAKALGIPMGAPIFQHRALCQQHDVVIKSSNYALYGDMSRRMLRVLQEFSPGVESYSIDESFLELTGFAKPGEYAHTIRTAVLRRVKITCGIGIGPTKTLAKFANHLAKTLPEWGGVFNLLDQSEADIGQFMAAYPVTEIWGVGRRSGPRLNALGIHTVLDLKRAEPRDIRREFGVVLERTLRELNGISCLDVEHIVPARQQIISSRSFGRPVYDLDSLRAALTLYMSRAAEKLRAQQGCAQMVTVMIRTSPFADPVRRYCQTTVVPLTRPSSDTAVLVAAALAGLDKIYQPGFRYQKGAVVLSEICTAAQVQADLFAPATDPKRTNLMQTLDRINRVYGRGTLKLASEALTEVWHTRSDGRSPSYTTSAQELPVVYAQG